jgi:type II secretory pathway pseudopilin PulG
MNIINKHKGFSLLETLLYIGLLSLIIVSIGSFYSLVIRERAKNNTIAEVEQQGQFIMDTITQSIRNAESVSLPVPQSSADSINLSMQDINKDPTVFSLSSQNIIVQEGIGSLVNLNGDRVEALEIIFTNMTLPGSPGSIKVSFVLKYKNPGSRYEFDYTKTFSSSASLRE